MIDDVIAARERALQQIDGAGSLEALVALDAALLGKRGAFAEFKSSLASLATVEEKKAAGQAVNEATQVVTAAFEARRSGLTAAVASVMGWSPG